MSFEFFDPDAETSIKSRNLPHWYQKGVTYFVTFRTADSLPGSVLDEWNATRIDWLRQHGIDPNTQPEWHDRIARLPQPIRREFRRRFSEAFHRYLDAGYGECVLRRPELQQLVGNSLLHFDRVRYDMSDFVIMPNHVHLLFGLRSGTALDQQCKSWKKFTATEINKVLGRRGHFWQGESFDHLVRNAEWFTYFRAYIADNPRKANLSEGDYLLYRRPDTGA